MHLTFLGTAAATALPLPFCHCPVCCQARSLGGKDLRRRSSLLVNGDLLLDLGPDAPSSAAHFGKDLSSLRYLLQTHAHSDHFDAAHLVTRLAEYASRDVSPLAIACSRQTAAAMSAALFREEADASLLDASWQRRLGISCQIARPGRVFSLGPYRILPLPSAHDPAGGSLLYCLWDGEKALLYATDSLFFDASIWAMLRSFAHPLSCAVLDHTYGPGIQGEGHMNADQVAETARLLRAHRLLAPGGIVLATHISHEGNPPHEALCQWAAQKGYCIAYDGLSIQL